MTLSALVLVLTAAVFHATWNFLAKRVQGGAPFVWLFNALSSLIFAPVAAVILLFEMPRLEPLVIVCMVGSGVLHIVYFLSLQRGYAVGDLSVVYPLARGTGPLLATAAAVVLLGERPGAVAVLGIALVTAGVFLLTTEGGSGRGFSLGKGAGYGLLTGCFIAAYTLVDKQAVSALHVPPLLQYWAANTVLVTLLSPLGLRRWEEVTAVWRAHRFETLGIAVLSPLSYVLVLTALVFTPLSYVAPAREISILIGAAMGARLLAEGNTSRRLLAAGVMVLGIAALALG